MSVQFRTPLDTLFNAIGVPLDGGKLYFWESGTSTPLDTYSDDDLTVPNTNPVVLDSEGRHGPIYLQSESYKITLKNSVGELIGETIDPFRGNLGDDVIVDREFPHTVPITLRQWIAALPVSGREFGVLVDGTGLSLKLCNAAVDLQDAGGGELILPSGTFTLDGVTGSDGKKNGILIPFTSQTSSSARVGIRGQGRSTVLRAGSTGMYIARLADSRCYFRDLTFDGNSLGTVSGLGIVPEDINQTTAIVYQYFNNFSNLEFRNCINAIELKCGPDVGGGDSGCWLNQFYDINIYKCQRGVWMRDGPNVGSSGINRCKFYGMRIGEDVNTGIQIDAGVQNRFIGIDFEGIQDTGGTPNAVATGAKVAESSVMSGDNNFNSFAFCSFENVTRHFDAPLIRIGIFDCQYDAAASVLAPKPLYSLGGEAPNLSPQIIADAFFYQTGNQVAGFDPGVLYLPAPEGINVSNGGAKIAGPTFRAFAVGTGILNGGTFTITAPEAYCTYLLSVLGNPNTTQPHISFVGTDAVNPVVPSVVNAGGITLNVVGNLITMTNVTGVTGNFVARLFQL